MMQTPQQFPMHLVEDFAFDGFEGAPSSCGVLVLRSLGAATAVIVELPGNPGSSISHSLESIATRLYRERLMGEVPAWCVRWYAFFPGSPGRPEMYHRIKFDWHPGAEPDGGLKRARWEALRAREALLLIRDLNSEGLTRQPVQGRFRK